MPFEFNFYSSLLLIFFVHGFVYACLFFKKAWQNQSASDGWIGLYLLLCILYICPWMLGFAGWYDGNTCMECRNFLFYMPTQHMLLMGPVVYFYVRTRLEPKFVFNRRVALHLLPGLLYILWNIIVAVTDRVVLKAYVLMDGQTDPDFQTWYQASGLISFMVYLFMSLRFYNQYRQFIVQELSFADAISFQWVRNFLLACLAYFLMTIGLEILNIFFDGLNYTGTWWYFLLFALTFYYIAINAYSHSVETRRAFELDFLRYQPLLTAPSAPVEDTTHEVVASAVKATDELAEWRTKVEAVVTGEMLYQDPELSLSQLAKALNTNPSFLSRVINQGFGMNFNDYINQQRVAEVVARLEKGDQAQFTIMSMAYDAGFNSKATFNRAFRKFTGKNPSDYAQS
jgi:AraC-like DNA-binding protein